ncbi:hypothetical protein GCM10009863_63970 [Streptomyces axinellae]|uniref:Resolvase/invertase-type recombinase catalytic domain-containing protein n=1 Tax=Streptomyces axinellae TaxID=552788 RepID=A0ABN3QY72_9ACTN
MHISEMFRLVRGNQHILHVLDVLHRDRLALRIHDGAFSAMDLTARHPRTGELLSTVKFTVQTLAAAGELQRDLQRELTYDGLRAAEAKGSKGGRRPAITAAKTDAVRTAYLEGRSIAALARQHGVSRGAIRTAVADLMPEHATLDPEDAPAPELPVVLTVPLGTPRTPSLQSRCRTRRWPGSRGSLRLRCSPIRVGPRRPSVSRGTVTTRCICLPSPCERSGDPGCFLTTSIGLPAGEYRPLPTLQPR